MALADCAERGVHLLLGDCLQRMEDIPPGSVDMILCDLPYGTTECKWDSVIHLPELWRQYERVVRTDGAIVLTAAQPFTTALAASNLRGFKYSLVWNKHFSGNFVQAKRMPLRTHEDVLVFCFAGKMPRYFPQMVKRDKPIKAGATTASWDAAPNRSSPEAREALKLKVYDEKYPISILDFTNRGSGDRDLHPTQKPVGLMEYLIKTYTVEGDTVLDNAMGSGTTGVACRNLGRNFIGIEMDETYFDVAKKRILSAKA